MELQLKTKLALVTGSTSGIGKAIARKLAEEGARVLINGRTEESVAETIRELGAHGRFSGAPGDVSAAHGTRQVLARAEEIGPIDILVNNAGIFEAKPFEEIPDEDWIRFFEVNVLSGVRLARALAPRMRDRGWGRIVFVSSESALNVPTEMIHYGMTKTAQLAVSRGLAKTLKGTGVTVNSVLPGPTWSKGVADFVERMLGESDRPLEEAKQAFIQQNRPGSIIQRFADPAEVAAMAAYICSPLASATTGAALRVDGGIVDSIA